MSTKTKTLMPDGELRENITPPWKTPNNHDTNFESDRTATYITEPSLTKQEFKEDSDINVILDRFIKTNAPPPMALPEHFGDLTTRLTYYDAANAMAEANQLFYTLPPGQRAIYLNDPNRWADAIMVALEKGDTDTLIANGIEVTTRQPQSGDLPNPLPKTPTPVSRKTPSGADTEDTPPVTPQSDTKKT